MTVRSFDSLPGTADAKRVIETVNRINGGKVNVVYGPFTLTANATTSALTDSRISQQSQIQWTPTTANAAAAMTNLYVSAQLNGSATLTHSNTATTDRTFNVLIIG